VLLLFISLLSLFLKVATLFISLAVLFMKNAALFISLASTLIMFASLFIHLITTLPYNVVTYIEAAALLCNVLFNPPTYVAIQK